MGESKLNMKLASIFFLSNVFCDPINNQNDNKKNAVEKLCIHENCRQLTESVLEVKAQDDEKASCSKDQKNSIITSRLSRCDYYNVSHSECIKYVEKELENSCGGSYSCIESARGDWAGFANYYGTSEKRYAQCGYHDGSNQVNSSVLSTSCSNALRNCYSASCVRDYVKGAFDDRIYKFCPNNMNLLVTAESWASWAYGLAYYTSSTYDCVAYCVP